MSRTALEAALAGRLDSAGCAWLRAALDEAARGPGAGFLRRWNEAGRRVGRAPVGLGGRTMAALRAAGEPVPEGWAMDECGRALLLGRAIEAAGDGTHVALIETLYRTGELREQRAVLRTLAYLPDPARFIEIAIEGVRSNALDLLEAIACENPYPAAFLAPEAFNQMVLKVLFCDLRLGRIEGLAGRLSPELARQVAAFARERRLAGRPVPEDVSLIVTGEVDAPV